MKMGISAKMALPVVGLTVVLGVAGFVVTQNRLDALNRAGLERFFENKQAEVAETVESSSRLAMHMASLFSQMPQVLEAYRTAHRGDIKSAADPQAQAAREALRRDLAGALAGYEDAAGGKLQLHFHLPGGRSLVRLWRDKQTESDDISDFRQTVLDVNETGKAVAGIELGRGGFVMRGLAPVKDGGRTLGSVEVLLPFDSVLEAASKGEGKELLLYMNKEFLDITTRLKDPAKNPVLGGAYVLVANTGGEDLHEDMEKTFLDAGAEGLSMQDHGDHYQAAFPVRDYKDRQIGVMVFEMDAARQAQIIGEARATLGGVLLAILVLPVVAVMLIVARLIVKPIKDITHFIQDIVNDKADLSKNMELRQKDEIGDLGKWFDTLTTKVGDIICETEGYENLINAVPDPIFAVDENYKLIKANKATAEVLGKRLDELMGERCMDHFNTTICNSDGCPVACAKKKQGPVTVDILDLSTPDQPFFIAPSADILRDCDGNVIGYIEVARVVTDQVLKEKDIQKSLERTERVNEQTQDASVRIAEATQQLSTEFERISVGANEQRDRVQETATAMEQMNATVAEVAQSASNAASQADQAREKAVEGADIVSRSIEAIGQVREQAMAMKENMETLGQRAEGIGDIMNVITDIADQTNLLALNAAIEAARAGEAGRGFAVVADEVRKLAEKTMSATKEVGQAITAIQEGTRQNVQAVEGAVQAVEQATELVGASGAALNEIVELVVGTNEQVSSIATAAEEQSAASEQINRAISEVNRIADETSQGMEDSTGSVMELTSLASRLKEIAEG